MATHDATSWRRCSGTLLECRGGGLGFVQCSDCFGVPVSWSGLYGDPDMGLPPNDALGLAGM